MMYCRMQKLRDDTRMLTDSNAAVKFLDALETDAYIFPFSIWSMHCLIGLETPIPWPRSMRLLNGLNWPMYTMQLRIVGLIHPTRVCSTTSKSIQVQILIVVSRQLPAAVVRAGSLSMVAVHRHARARGRQQLVLVSF